MRACEHGGAATRRVLVVSYLFPPFANASVHRWAKMTKYLAEFGWRATVVTAAEERRAGTDVALAGEIPPHVRVIHVPDYGLKYAAAAARRLLRLPLMEGHEGWVAFATRRVLSELAAGRYDALCTTLGPFTLMKIGVAARRRFSVPWVMDLRDPSWTHQARGVDSPALGVWEGARRRRLEANAFGHADAVVTVDEDVRDALQRSPEVRADVHLVPNGYDDDDFPAPWRADPHRREFTMTFVGKLRAADRYQGLLRALGRVARRRENRPPLRACFAGEIDHVVVKDLRRALPPECLRIEGYLPVREACRRLVESDLLLFVLPAYAEGGALRVHSKTYNYLRAGRPILAPIPDGAAARLLARSGAGIVVPPDDDAAIGRALLEALDGWRRGTLAARTDWNLVRQFDRRKLAARFARVLDNLPGARDAGRLVRAAGGERS